MAVEYKTITIDGDEYGITTFMATKGIGYLKRIVKVVGTSFASLAEGNEESALTNAINALVENLDKDNVEQLIKELLSSVRKNNQEINFESEFAANYGVLLKLIVFVVQENYGSFFAQSAIESAKLQMKE